MNPQKIYRNLDEFYPYYLSEHANRSCRRLHFIGTTLAMLLILVGLITQRWWLIPAALIEGYAFSWVGHFYFEHNRPATFQHPWLSYFGDMRMWREMLTGRIRF